MIRNSSRALALYCAAAIAAAVAPPADAQEGRFGSTTEVILVEVPVQVIRDGQPVRGLSSEDFVVYDGRKKQEVVGFEIVDLYGEQADGERRPVTALPGAARRHFLLLFDLSFSDPSAVVRARQAAYELVIEGLHPSDLVAVATYSESKGPNLVLGFTSDRTQVQAAVETLGVADPAEQIADPLGLVIGSLEPSPGGDGGGGRGLAGNRDQVILDHLRSLSSLSSRAARDQKVAQVEALSSSLTQIAAMLNSVQGRKHVVYLSEGFDASVVIGTGGTTQEEQERIQEVNNAAASGEFWRVDSEERFGDTSALNVVGAMLEAFRRADCVIQSVDIGGLRAGGEVQGARAESGTGAKGQDGLFMMANETGGELYRNFNDLSAAMGQMLERTSVTYVLAFQPKDLELDGKFHNLKVELAQGGKGARVVHRPGYYAPRPYAELSAIERRLSASESIVGGDAGGRLALSVLAAPVRVDGQQAYVPVLVEIDGSDLLAGHEGGVIPTEIYAYALTAQGAVADFFSQALGLDAAEARAALEQSGFKFWGHFDLDPGEYTVRVMARNGETGVAGLASVPLRVPSFERAEAVLLPPLFPEPAGKWLIGREQQAEQRDVPYPFMLHGQAFIPAARPAVKRGGQAQLFLMGYHLAADATVEGELYGSDGAAASGWSLAVLERTAAGGADQLVATLQLEGLAAGEYTLVVTVGDGAGGTVQSASIPVVVEG